MSQFKYKPISLPSGEAIFSVSSGEIPEKISSQFVNNFVSISTPDALTAGTFECFVELVKDGGFHSALVINETYTQLPATSVGATVADGAVGAFSFTGNPYRIKVVATGVTGATEANVVIAQEVA